MPKLLWQPPKEGWIKINVDESYVQATGQASAVRKIMLHLSYGCWTVACGCLQRSAAAGIAWQLLGQHGTTSEDGVCSANIVGQLGLQSLARRLQHGISSEDDASDNLSC